MVVTVGSACSDRQPETPTAQKPSGKPPLDSHWECIYIQGRPVGYSQITVTAEKDSLWKLENRTFLKVRRFEQTLDQQIAMTAWETDSGQMNSIRCVMTSAGSQMEVTGRLNGGKLELTTTTGGIPRSRRIDWPATAGGYFAVERSLYSHPLRPGETRTLQMVPPLSEQLTNVHLSAGALEKTALLGETAELLRVEAQMEIGKETLRSVLWVDERGRVLKSQLPGADQTSIWCTEEQALATRAAPLLDLGTTMSVPLDKPLGSPHQTRRAIYRITLRDADPAESFPQDWLQSVESLGDNQARITRAATRPGDLQRPTDRSPRPPEPADSGPNAFIQSDDQQIRAMAQAIAPEESEPWKIAVALERHVFEIIEVKPFSQALASAVEVAQSRAGDCTEHAVLLAALCRARAIPTRVVTGLVYVTAQQGFAYHMWNEVWIDGHWYPLDSTLGLGGIGAAHLKLSDGNLHEQQAFEAFLPVLKVMGRMTIELEQADQT